MNRVINNIFLLIVLIILPFRIEKSFSTQLITKEIIQKQIKDTHKFVLKNGIPVTYRSINGSDILQIHLSFNMGYGDFSGIQRTAFNQMASLMATSAKGWSRARVFETLEKYTSAVSCNAGIEFTNCSLSTVNEYLDKIMPLFNAAVQTPSFNPKDIELSKQRKIAGIKQNIQNPGTYINDLINQIFYPLGHPYRLIFKKDLENTEKWDRNTIKSLHSSLLKSSFKFFTVVGSIDISKIEKTLNQSFSGIKISKESTKKVSHPKYSAKNNYIFEHRDIPTAYLRLKLNLPGIKNEDYTKIKLLYHILDEELSEEIRTKKSLSYSVYSYYIPYTVGIGTISASTSKPNETLDAINDVIKKIKTKKLSPEKLKEYKTVYTTRYFLTLETHSSLSGALAGYRFYFPEVNSFYQSSSKIEKVTPEDIIELANKYLVNPRLAILYNREKFKDKKANEFLTNFK